MRQWQLPPPAPPPPPACTGDSGHSTATDLVAGGAVAVAIPNRDGRLDFGCGTVVQSHVFPRKWAWVGP